MTDEVFNLSMRKFLKQVGVTSQQQIEEAVRKAHPQPGSRFNAKVVLTIDELGLRHEVDGDIRIGETAGGFE